MTHFKKLFALAALVATPVLAEGGPTDAQIEAFVTALMENGCVMSETEAAEILPPLGLDQDTSGLIADALITEGMAEVSEDGQVFTLLAEECVE